MAFLKPALVSLVALGCLALAAQENTPPRVTLKSIPKTAKPGQTVKAVVSVEFAEGLHGYQNPPTSEYEIPVKVSSETKGFALKATYPKGVLKKMNGADSAVYEGTIEIPVTLTVPKKAAKYDVKLTISYQQCNETACFPPGKVLAVTKIEVKAAKPKGKGR